MISGPTAPAGIDTEMPSTITDTDQSLAWTVWRLREQPDKMIVLGFAFAFILGCSVLGLHNIAAGLVGCAVTAGAVKEYLAPLRFSLSEAGAKVACAGVTWIEMPWNQVRSAYRTPAGLKLSPYANPARSRTESLRGMTLRFPAEMKPSVEAFVEAHIALTPVGGGKGA